MEEVNAAFAAIMTWFGKMNDKMNGKPPGENTTGEKMSDDNETDDKETDDDKVVGERVTASATEQGNPSSHGAALLHDSSDTTVARTKKADDPVVTYATAIAMQLMSMALLVSVFLMEEDDSVKIAPTAELPAPSRTQTPTPPTDSATEKGSPGAQEAMFHDSEDTTVTPTEKVDGDGVKYPTGIAMQLITLALLLSVFLMALDNTIVSGNTSSLLDSNCSAKLLAVVFKSPTSDMNTDRHRHSENHKPVPQSTRRGLVRLSLPTHDGLLPAPVRQALHLLLHKMGLHRGHQPL